jgi:hypothetical protein
MTAIRRLTVGSATCDRPGHDSVNTKFPVLVQFGMSQACPAVTENKTVAAAPHKYGTGSRPGSPRGQPAWGGSSDRVVDYQSPYK